MRTLIVEDFSHSIVHLYLTMKQCTVANSDKVDHWGWSTRTFDLEQKVRKWNAKVFKIMAKIKLSGILIILTNVDGEPLHVNWIGAFRKFTVKKKNFCWRNPPPKGQVMIWAEFLKRRHSGLLNKSLQSIWENRFGRISSAFCIVRIYVLPRPCLISSPFCFFRSKVFF